MKWLIYLFILANLSIFAWYYRTPTTDNDQQTQATNDAKSPRLVLLKEYLARQEKASDSSTTEISTQTESLQTETEMETNTVGRCYTLGPFTSKSQTTKVESYLQKLGLELQRREIKDNKLGGFWVIIPKHSSRRAAQASINKLKKRGVKDYFLVVTGGQKLAISLGVFSKPSSAKRRVNQIKRLGFAPSVRDIKLPQRQYWIDWPLSSSSVLSSKELDYLHKTYEGLGQVERDCDP